LSPEAVRGFVAGARVVHRDPGGTDEPGTQHIAGLARKPAEAAQQRHQSWHRHLSLMVLGKQLCSNVTGTAFRSKSGGLMKRTIAYITNYDTNNVSVLDIDTNTVVATIFLGSDNQTCGVAVTPDGSKVYVASRTGFTVLVIATATNKLTGSPIPVGDEPRAVAVTPDGSKVYVANEFGNSVSVIATDTNTVVATIPLGNSFFPTAVAVTPDGSKVYVANSSEKTVWVIDTHSNTVSGSPILVGEDPEALAITPDGSKVYVGNAFDQTVSVIATNTNTVVATIPVGNRPFGTIAVTPDDSKVYVPLEMSNSVSVIAAATNTVVATIPVGPSPLAVAVTPDGSKAYVTNSNSGGPGTVSVIDTTTNTVVATIPVGSFPCGVAVTRVWREGQK
jgi:YVTN family beta-propeller protein